MHVRPGDGSDDDSLTSAYEKAVRLAEEKSRNGTLSWVGEMEAVKEEDEDVASPGRCFGSIIDISAPGKELSSPTSKSNGITRPHRPKSLVLESKGDRQEDKEQAPLPKLTAGDSTIAGQQWPLVDEIACAIREWYGVSPAC